MGLLTGLPPPVFQVTVQRVASSAVRAEAGAVAVTALNLGVAAGAGAGGAALAAGGTDLLLTLAVVAAGVGSAVLWTRPGPAASTTGSTG